MVDSPLWQKSTVDFLFKGVFYLVYFYLLCFQNAYLHWFLKYTP